MEKTPLFRNTLAQILCKLWRKPPCFATLNNKGGFVKYSLFCPPSSPWFSHHNDSNKEADQHNRNNSNVSDRYIVIHFFSQSTSVSARNKLAERKRDEKPPSWIAHGAKNVTCHHSRAHQMSRWNIDILVMMMMIINLLTDFLLIFLCSWFFSVCEWWNTLAWYS